MFVKMEISVDGTVGQAFLLVAGLLISVCLPTEMTSRNAEEAKRLNTRRFLLRTAMTSRNACPTIIGFILNEEPEDETTGSTIVSPVV